MRATQQNAKMLQTTPMKIQRFVCRPAAWVRVSIISASLALAGNATALDVIGPTGTIYTNVVASSQFSQGFAASNLFNLDVSSYGIGDVLPTTSAEYAKSGSGSTFISFQLDTDYSIGSVYFAQRNGSTTGDNMQRMSIWTGSTTNFAAADPGVPAQNVVSLLPNTGPGKWLEYYLTNNSTMVGRYILIKLEQTTLAGNPGGSEMRLGLAPSIPVIGVQPTNQTVYSGATARLVSIGAGQGALAYQWQSSPVGAGTWSNVTDGGNISGATTAFLTIANIAVGDKDYRLLVTNGNGTGTSDTATLSVSTAAPFIISNITPSTLAQPAGYRFTLTVTADGSRPISYQWQRNGVNLADGANIVGSQSNILTILNAQSGDAGAYQLIMNNTYGPGLSATGTVSIVPSLPVLSPTGVLYADVSASSTFSSGFVSSNLFKQDVTQIPPGATISGGTEYAKSGPGSSYVAFRVDNIYTIGSVFYAQRNGSGTGDNMQKMSIWTRTNAAFATSDPGTPPDAFVNLLPNSGTPVWREYFLTNNLVGQYFLLKLEQTTVTGNPGGNEFRLGLFQQAPAIGTPPADQQAYDGNTVVLSAVASGAQPLKYQWQVSPADAGTFANVTDNANIIGSGTSTLTLKNVPLANYDYRVIVSNSFGMATSAPPARLSVLTTAPQITSDLSPTSLQQPIGFAFQYSVSVIGSTPMTFQWTHNGSPLSDNSRVSGSHSNVLTVLNAQSGDEGTYQLNINNNYGPAQSAESTLSLVSGFGVYDGSAWMLNGGATAADGVLNMTDAAASQGRTAFFRTSLSVTSFLATFTYQDVTGGGGDGVGFIVQNSPNGPAAIGPGGGGFAYAGISPSAAILFNAFSGAQGGRGIAFMTNGNTPQFLGTNSTFSSTAPVNLASGNPIDIVVRYGLNALSVKLTDTVSNTSFSTNITLNLPAVLGKGTAYVGFSGATGGVNAQQQISKVTFVNLPFITAQRTGNNLVLSWPVGPTDLSLQFCTDLGLQDWQYEPATPSTVNGIKSVTVSLSGPAKYYRLTMP